MSWHDNRTIYGVLYTRNGLLMFLFYIELNRHAQALYTKKSNEIQANVNTVLKIVFVVTFLYI